MEEKTTPFKGLVPANIFQKMMLVSGDIAKVSKNLEVGFGKGKYRAVSEADILAAVKPAEIAHGVYSYPVSRAIIESGEMTTSNGNKQVFLRMETVYRFVNADNPSDYLEITSYGDGVDSQDKAPGKAMTYADKYALMKAYKIQTGDDPDQDASQPIKAYEAQGGKPRRVDREKAAELTERLRTLGVNISKLLAPYKVEKIEDMYIPQYEHLLERVEKYENENHREDKAD